MMWYATTMICETLSQSKFQFIPLQDFTKPWTDEELYKKYKLSDDEITFIESMIKPMELFSSYPWRLWPPSGKSLACALPLSGASNERLVGLMIQRLIG